MLRNQPEKAFGTRSDQSRWGRFFELAQSVLEGHRISPAEARQILFTEESELPELVAAAHKIRWHFFRDTVQLNVLINAKSGLCGEDCAYCSQSRVSTAAIARYELVDEEVLLAGAGLACERRAQTYCIVLSGLRPARRDLENLARVIPKIRARFPLRICVSTGLLGLAEAKILKEAGVCRVNHNLNTSRRFYPQICSTHRYEERLATLEAVRQAGLELCSGGIIGMGEEPEDIVDFALTLAQFQPEAVPINFLIPIPGTPLGHRSLLCPRFCLKVLCLFRFAIPACELRIAAGRELHLRSLQPVGLWIANSIFVGDYLTTKGQPPEDDFRMIEDLGLEPEFDVVAGARSAGLSGET
ncbi:MAG: biotin synthase BioB [Thermoguttaceae bacterium]|nr:biotin synthase BioB [Thermoguttaceae bacterium]